MTATDTAVNLARIAGQAAADRLATDIVLIDVSDRLAITDVFVIATGSNERQVEAIVDEVEEHLRRAGVKPLRREGKRDGRWVLLDYAEIVVHIQHSEERVFYSLERLWKDCPMIEFTDAALAARQAAAPGEIGSAAPAADGGSAVDADQSGSAAVEPQGDPE